MKDITPLVHALAEVREEVLRAQELHPRQHSLHEAYGILMEEVKEFEEQVFLKARLRSPGNISKELTQIAAMAIRTKLDLDYRKDCEDEFDAVTGDRLGSV